MISLFSHGFCTRGNASELFQASESVFGVAVQNRFFKYHVRMFQDCKHSPFVQIVRRRNWYMGHNRGGEEALSALSRAFIEKEQLNEQQNKNEEKKVEPVKWPLFTEQPTMTNKKKVSMDALRIMLNVLTVITRTHTHVSLLFTLIHTIMNYLLWSCLLV